jgi:hypothetical protein
MTIQNTFQCYYCCYYCSRSEKGLFHPHVLAGPDVTLQWRITSRRACDTLLHVIYALTRKFREKFEAGPDIELLLYLRPDATIMVYSVPPSGKLGAG